jgi:hypothetical protein
MTKVTPKQEAKMDGKRNARHHALAMFLGDWKA